MLLENKIALITGAASGIGLEQTRQFIEEGAHVIAVDMDEDGLKEVEKSVPESGEKLTTKICDLSDSEAIHALTEEVMEEFDIVDVLVNTAGLFDNYRKLLDTEEDLWNQSFAINVTAHFLLTKAFLPKMVEQGEGNIISVASRSGLIGGSAGPSYTASKHAAVGLIREIASQYGEHGIRANGIAPGIIETPMTEESFDDEDIKEIPLKEVGQASDVADLTVFLASNKSAHISGTIIPVDGGLFHTKK